MRFKVLGPVVATRDDGPISLGGPKQRLVLAHLIVRHATRHEALRPALHVVEAPLVPVEPVVRFLRQDGDDLLVRAGMPRREVELAPVDAAALARGRVPRMMRIGKAHPHEPARVGGE